MLAMSRRGARSAARHVNKAQQTRTRHVGSRWGYEIFESGEQLDGERIEPLR